MAKKELTEEEIIKKQYSKLNDLNQRLKNICSAYYISHNGVIYMKSLVTFIEKVVHLANPESISRFYGAMILPNEFFEFNKNAKKSKLVITQAENTFHFGQDDNPELVYAVNIVNPNKDVDSDYIETIIKPKMYKRFFDIRGDQYKLYDDNEVFRELPLDVTSQLLKSEPVYLDVEGTPITLTKHLLLDLKKEESLSIARVSYQIIDKESCRTMYLIKNINSIYENYTLFNTLQKY